MNDFDSNNNLIKIKADFFDVFYTHIKDLVKNIELLASGLDDEASLKLQTGLFERIILLYKTGSNIKHLCKNMDSLNVIRANNYNDTNGLTKSQNSDVASVNAVKDSNSKTPINTDLHDNVIDASTPNKAVNQNSSVSLPQESTDKKSDLANSDNDDIEGKSDNRIIKKKIESSDTNSSIINRIMLSDSTGTDNISSSKNDQNSTPKKVIESKEIKEVDNIPFPKNDQNSTSKKVIENKEIKEADDLPNASVAHPSDISKTDSLKVRAILVNDKQFDKLRLSRDKQILEASFSQIKAVSKDRINDLMKKASSLYKNGKVAEAQRMYEEIRKMSKKMVKSKVL